MNKSELIAVIADQAGVSNKDAGACLDAFCDVVASTVAGGGKVGDAAGSVEAPLVAMVAQGSSSFTSPI